MNLDEETMREPPSPEYSEEECERVIQYCMSLKKDLIKKFLERNGIPKSGTKQELRRRIKRHLGEGTIDYGDLVIFLDTVAPFGKQHVYLYYGPESEIENWRDRDYVINILDENGFSKCLNSCIPLILPKELTLASIEHRPNDELVIYAVEGREYRERKKELDETKTVGEEEIELRAYIHQVARGVVTFRWDLVSNDAMLQISQLPKGSKYEKIEETFADMIMPVLDLIRFQKLDLKPAIKKLHELEADGNPEARPHGVSYRSQGGRRVSVESATPSDSVSGEPTVDDAFGNIRRQGVGHLGNFYWHPVSVNNANGNPLLKEVHASIVGNKDRINFHTPNREEDLKYVLSRIRALSR